MPKPRKLDMKILLPERIRAYLEASGLEPSLYLRRHSPPEQRGR